MEDLENIEKYKNHLIEKLFSIDKYSEYLHEHIDSLILFLDIIEIKEGTNLNKVTEILELMNKLQEGRADILNKIATFLNESSKTISLKDVHEKTIFYNRILKIKGIEKE